MVGRISRVRTWSPSLTASLTSGTRRAFQSSTNQTLALSVSPSTGQSRKSAGPRETSEEECPSVTLLSRACTLATHSTTAAISPSYCRVRVSTSSSRCLRYLPRKPLKGGRVKKLLALVSVNKQTWVKTRQISGDNSADICYVFHSEINNAVRLVTMLLYCEPCYLWLARCDSRRGPNESCVSAASWSSS